MSSTSCLWVRFSFRSSRWSSENSYYVLRPLGWDGFAPKQISSVEDSQTHFCITHFVLPEFRFLLQLALFDALGLVPIRQLPKAGVSSSISRVVLLVPPLGLVPLRGFGCPYVFLRLSEAHRPIDTHVMSVHMAFVRVRRGRSVLWKDGNDWHSINQHLEVRNTQENDPDAELMVSAIVSKVELNPAALSLTDVQLRPVESADMFQPP